MRWTLFKVSLWINLHIKTVPPYLQCTLSNVTEEQAFVVPMQSSRWGECCSPPINSKKKRIERRMIPKFSFSVAHNFSSNNRAHCPRSVLRLISHHDHSSHKIKVALLGCDCCGRQWAVWLPSLFRSQFVQLRRLKFFGYCSTLW